MAGKKYQLRGKIIDEYTKPASDLKVLAFDHDPLLNPDDFLGDDTTSSKGSFRIDFDDSKFKSFFEPLEGTPEVYLIVRRNEREVLKTKMKQTKKEIEYHIKLNGHVPDPNARDIYSDNRRRVIGMLGDVSSMIDYENAINLDALNNRDLPADIRKRLERFKAGYEDRRNNAHAAFALLDGFISTLGERYFGIIGYDGAQVPRHPRRKEYDQAIIWPRKEEFKWG